MQKVPYRKSVREPFPLQKQVKKEIDNMLEYENIIGS